MEKTNKVMNIVLSVVTFVAIALFAGGIFALPLTALKVDGAGTVGSANIYEFIEQLIERIKNMECRTPEQVAEAISQLIMAIVAVGLTVVFGIIALVKGIILLVKTIKGMSGKGELEDLRKALVGFGSILVLYIGLLLGAIYLSTGGSVTSLGVGSEMALSAGMLALAVVAVYHIANKDETKLLNKILGLGTSCLALMAFFFAFAMPLAQGDNTMSLYNVITIFINGMTGSPEGSVMFGLMLAFFGAVVVIVSSGFAKGVIVNGFMLKEKDKKADHAKSSIVKSAVMFGLMVIGLVLVAIPLSKHGYGMGIGGILGMVFGAMALACAIVNKVLSPKAPAKEEAKAE